MQNLCIFTGRLTADAELAQTKNGNDVLNFSIACETGWGEHARVDYFNCQQWGKRANALEQYLKKGTKVFVRGRMQMSKTEKDGVKRTYFTLNVGDLEFMGSARNKQENQTTAQILEQSGATNIFQTDKNGQGTL